MISTNALNDCLLAILLIVLIFRFSVILYVDVYTRYRKMKKDSFLRKKKELWIDLSEAHKKERECREMLYSITPSNTETIHQDMAYCYDELLKILEKKVLDKTVELEKVNELLRFYE
jgi:hypothetical protein